MTSPLAGVAGDSADASSPNAGIGVQATDGLIAHWALNEGSGTFAADAANGHSGTLAIGATWTTGRMGSGVQLDGTRGYIAAPIIDVPGSALTLAAWVNVAGYARDVDQRIISKATGTSEKADYWTLSHVSRRGRNLLAFRLRAGGTTTTLIASNGDLPGNAWFHAAATYDGATMRVYLNGVEVGRTAKTGIVGTSALVPVDIGRSPDGSNHLHGVIDEVRIYGRALAGDEIADVMTDPGDPGLDAGSESSDPEVVSLTPAGADTAESVITTTESPDGGAPTPMAHWRLDEGSGTTAADSANGGTATLAGGATWAGGWSAYGVSLNGNTAYLDAPSLDVAGSALTLAAWVKNNAFPAGVNQHIISKSNDTAKQARFWMLSHVKKKGRNLLSFRLRTGTTTTTLVAATGDLPSNTWYHAAATYDGTRMRLYLNGVEVGATSKTGTIAANLNAPVNIGRNPDGSNYLSGVIDDVRIYNRALTAADVTAVMNDTGTSNEPPTVTLSTPADGASFSAPADITLTASASDPENRLADVQFYSGTTLLGTDSTAPYTFTWSAVPAGSYSLTAVARDSNGASTTSTAVAISVTAPANQPPTVTLTAPASGATFTAPATVAITASASDPENRLTDVRFYAGSTLLGSDTTAPYAFTWSSVAAGSYSITAVARDADGGSTTSTAVAITVTSANQAPTVALTAPASGATYTAPATVAITVSASDPENRLTDVRLYAGSTLLGTDTTAPYAFTWSSVAAGSYSITAVARDADGGSTTSTAVAITVTSANQAPTVALTAPVNGAIYTAPATVVITATAADPENRLADVRFYAGTALLGTDTTAPYSFTWSSVPAGSYWITAVARDSEGATASSFASGITVTAVAPAPWRVAFTASADHATNVTSYLVEVFASGADPNIATPVSSSDLGKPTLNSLGEVIVDRTSFFEALPAGNYVLTVRAIGSGGSTRSAPYTFSR